MMIIPPCMHACMHVLHTSHDITSSCANGDQDLPITAHHTTTPHRTQVCHEAAMGPIRELGPAALLSVKAEDVRALEEKVRIRLSLITFSS